MTVIAWRLFQKDRNLHFGFILYRLKRDLGFTFWELANITGIPKAQVEDYINLTLPILEGEILKTLAKMDWAEEEHAWRSLRRGGLPQGYFIKKEVPWYKDGKEGFYVKFTRSAFQIGGETEREYESKLRKGEHAAKISEETRDS